jgi:5-methylcytosine-specific restriction endonuclease McrA
MNDVARPHALRAPCVCGSELGVVLERNGQDTVRCARCEKFQYNAPRVETGRVQRSVSTVHAAIRPKQRARILERAGARCEVCGARDRLHVGHILAVAVGLSYGLTEVELNHDENLLALCEECNLGQGGAPMSLRLAIAIVRARIAWSAS